MQIDYEGILKEYSDLGSYSDDYETIYTIKWSLRDSRYNPYHIISDIFDYYSSFVENLECIEIFKDELTSNYGLNTIVK